MQDDGRMDPLDEVVESLTRSIDAGKGQALTVEEYRLLDKSQDSDIREWSKRDLAVLDRALIKKRGRGQPIQHPMGAWVITGRGADLIVTAEEGKALHANETLPKIEAVLAGEPCPGCGEVHKVGPRERVMLLVERDRLRKDQRGH